MSALEKYAVARFLFSLIFFSLTISPLLLSFSGEISGRYGSDWVTSCIILHMVIGGGVGMWGRRKPNIFEDERDLAIARRARGFALFFICFSLYWSAEFIGLRKYESSLISRIYIAQYMLALIPLTLSVEAFSCMIMYRRDRKGLER